MRVKSGIVLVALAMAQAAQAQSIVQWVPTPTTTPGARAFFLPIGTPVKLRIISQISSRDNKPGDTVFLEVAENVTFRGQTVIPVGTPVMGQVSELEHNGWFGKSGKIGLRLSDMQMPGGPVRLGGEASRKGHSQTTLSVATILFVSGCGMFIHGESGKIMPGDPVDAYLLNNLQFTWYPSGDAAQLGDSTPVQRDGSVLPGTVSGPRVSMAN